MDTIKNEGFGSRLGTAIGSSLGQGLEALAQHKMQSVLKQKSDQLRAQQLEQSGLFKPGEARGLASLSDQLLSPIIKDRLRAPQEEANARMFRELFGMGGNEQGGGFQPSGNEPSNEFQPTSNGRPLFDANETDLGDISRVGGISKNTIPATGEQFGAGLSNTPTRMSNSDTARYLGLGMQKQGLDIKKEANEIRRKQAETRAKGTESQIKHREFQEKLAEKKEGRAEIEEVEKHLEQYNTQLDNRVQVANDNKWRFSAIRSLLKNPEGFPSTLLANYLKNHDMASGDLIGRNAEILQKITADMAKNLPMLSSANGGSIPVAEFQALEKAIPSIIMTPEGIQDVVNLFENAEKLDQARVKARANILEKNNQKPPRRMRAMIEERVAPLNEKIAKKAGEIVARIPQPGNVYANLKDAAKTPGTFIRDRSSGSLLITYIGKDNKLHQRKATQADVDASNAKLQQPQQEEI